MLHRQLLTLRVSKEASRVQATSEVERTPITLYNTPSRVQALLQVISKGGKMRVKVGTYTSDLLQNTSILFPWLTTTILTTSIEFLVLFLHTSVLLTLVSFCYNKDLHSWFLFILTVYCYWSHYNSHLLFSGLEAPLFLLTYVQLDVVTQSCAVRQMKLGTHKPYVRLSAWHSQCLLLLHNTNLQDSLLMGV